jgi:hypothetical protein
VLQAGSHHAWDQSVWLNGDSAPVVRFDGEILLLNYLLLLRGGSRKACSTPILLLTWPQKLAQFVAPGCGHDTFIQRGVIKNGSFTQMSPRTSATLGNVQAPGIETFPI